MIDEMTKKKAVDIQVEPKRINRDLASKCLVLLRHIMDIHPLIADILLRAEHNIDHGIKKDYSYITTEHARITHLFPRKNDMV